MSDHVELFVAKVREIADRFPDVCYDVDVVAPCLYRPNEGNPYGCIVGLAARELHAEGKIGRDFDGTEFDEVSASDAVLSLAASDDGAWLNSKASWLDKVQSSQDAGWTWAEAVRRADW